MPTRSETLEFESGHFLHSLFANDESLLRDVGQTLSVEVASRDGWIRFEGDGEGVERARDLFKDLEKTRRQGLEINLPVFRLALKASSDQGAAPLLQELIAHRLLGTPSKPAVVPQSLSQLRYLKALEEEDVVFGTGSAGTGKTYLAMAAALSALKQGQVRRVVLTRPAVEAGEALGFLPGDFEAKLFPYLRPLYDALYDMLEPDEVEKFIDKGLIEIAPLAYMRGRTLANCFVILDEAQNTTCEQMFMFLTRIGIGSRCAVTGDPTQTDLKGGQRSGLVEALHLLRGTRGIDVIEFEAVDVVRHPVVRRIIEAYERGRE